MKEQSLTLYEVTSEEIAELADGTAVLVYDTLYERYEIKHAGKNKFPAVRRFVYLLFKAPNYDKSQIARITRRSKNESKLTKFFN